MPHHRILIVGAGPTGLTAALELARRGIVPEVVEKRATPSGLSRAVGILPRTMRLLQPSGVSEAIRNEAVAIGGVRLHLDDALIARIALNLESDPNNRLFALAQDRTETHLCEAFTRHGGSVRYGATLEAITQTEDKVQVTVDGSPDDYDYVIGADGAGSVVRQALGIAFDGIDLPEKWAIADVDCPDWPSPECFCLYLCSAGRVVVVVPLEATRFRVISNTEDALATLPVPMPVSHIRRQASFHIAVRQATHYRQGRVFLAGDAAHCHSPVGGRGMNLGIADAAELARCIVEDDLDGYQAARHPHGTQTIAMSERARKTATASSAWRRGLLTVPIRLASALPPLQRRLGRVLLDL